VATLAGVADRGRPNGRSETEWIEDQPPDRVAGDCELTRLDLDHLAVQTQQGEEEGRKTCGEHEYADDEAENVWEAGQDERDEPRQDIQRHVSERPQSKAGI